MGGEGSGNSGRRKFGNKYYNYTGSHSTGMKASRSANQYEASGIPAKIKKEPARESVYEGRIGYSVYTHGSRKQSRKARNGPASGTRHSY